MKACAFLAILCFAFCAVKALTSTTHSITVPTTPSITVPTPTSSDNISANANSTVSTSPAATSSDISTTVENSIESTSQTIVTTPTTTSNPSTTDANSITTTTSTSSSTQPTTSTTVPILTSSGDTSTNKIVTQSASPSTVTNSDVSGDTSTNKIDTESTSPATVTDSAVSGDTSTNKIDTESTSPATVTDSAVSDPSTTDANSITTTTSTSSSTQPTTSTTVPIPTSSAPLPCKKNPCVYGAECVNLADQQYVCQCSFGSYYTNTSGCQQGKIFPGDLSLTNQRYNPLFANTTTTEYKELYDNVTQFFKNAFKNEPTYKETIISSVRPSSSTLRRLNKAEGTSSTVVSLINMFDMSTTLSSSQVQGLVQTAIIGGYLSGASFKSTPQCNILDTCDNQTTDCTEKDDNTIATCTCKPGLDKKNPQDTSCLLCADCTQENNKQCVIKEGMPQCQCMTNFYAKDKGCQECDFGYSGENCKENYMAVIVGVSIACGIVIVVLAGVLIYNSLRARKKHNPERRSLLSNDYSATGRDLESKSAINVAPKEKIFPRIQMKSSAGQARNAGEGGLANSAYLPEQDYDDVNNIEMATRSKF